MVVKLPHSTISGMQKLTTLTRQANYSIIPKCTHTLRTKRLGTSFVSRITLNYDVQHKTPSPQLAHKQDRLRSRDMRTGITLFQKSTCSAHTHTPTQLEDKTAGQQLCIENYAQLRRSAQGYTVLYSLNQPTHEIEQYWNRYVESN